MKDIILKLQKMTVKQRTRSIIALCIEIILNVSAVSYVSEIFSYQPEVKPVRDMYIDGSNFTPLANLAVNGFNGFTYILTFVLSVAAVIFVGIILLVPFLLISLRKTAVIHDVEPLYAKGIILIGMLLTFAGCLLVSQFSLIIIDIILTMIPALLMLLLYYLPLKNRLKKQISNKVES